MTPIERARLSLEGLSVGDAFGERFFGEAEAAVARIKARKLAVAPWTYTDDTEMALSIVEVLDELGAIDPDVLMDRFVQRMQAGRGYGAFAYELLEGVRQGGDWRRLSRAGFRGVGSFGNGAAMRVAPLGAYFAEEPLGVVADQAKESAIVTHAHEEGVAGAIAIAVATAMAWQQRGDPGAPGARFLVAVRERIPGGHLRDAVDEAITVPATTPFADVVRQLGNGSGVSAPDTVPLCLWIVAHFTDFEEALWLTVSALGDRDTTCAMVGGMLAMRAGYEGIPKAWRVARERLPVEFELLGL